MTTEIPDGGQGGGGNQRAHEVLEASQIDRERPVELVEVEDEGHGGGGNQRLHAPSEVLDAEHRLRVADGGQGGGGNQLQQ